MAGYAALARRKGFEPPVFGIGIRCIIQLCYRRTCYIKSSGERRFLINLSVAFFEYGAELILLRVICLDFGGNLFEKQVCRLAFGHIYRAGRGSGVSASSETPGYLRGVDLAVGAD